MLIEFDSEYPVETAYKKIVGQSNDEGFEVRSTVKNKQIVVKGNRSFGIGGLIFFIIWSLIIFFVMLITGVVIAASTRSEIGFFIALPMLLLGMPIYHWVRPHERIIIELEPASAESSIIIITTGKISKSTIDEIKSYLKAK